jgi:ubiquinone/menaquinone biosynthesis C-methylase UbiE
MLNTSNTPSQLAKRLESNASSTRNLNDFIFDIVKPVETDIALDVGCGSGKQLVPMSDIVRHVVGIDVSPEFISDIVSLVSGKTNVSLHVCDMDDLLMTVDRGFSLIYSAYSIYYSKHIDNLIYDLNGMLTPGGRMFIMAPDVSNNMRWFTDLGEIFSVPAEIRRSGEVSCYEVVPAMLRCFDEIHCYRFENDVTFHTLDSLMSYYDGCQSYCSQKHRQDACEFFGNIFNTKGKYVIEKVALGVLGR